MKYLFSLLLLLSSTSAFAKITYKIDSSIGNGCGIFGYRISFYDDQGNMVYSGCYALERAAADLNKFEKQDRLKHDQTVTTSSIHPIVTTKAATVTGNLTLPKTIAGNTVIGGGTGTIVRGNVTGAGYTWQSTDKDKNCPAGTDKITDSMGGGSHCRDNNLASPCCVSGTAN